MRGERGDDGEARHLGGCYGWIVAAASVRAPGSWARTAVPCWRKPNGKRCTGVIRARAIDVPSRVMWSCDRCSHNGFVRNWHRTSWNLRALASSHDREGVEIAVTDRQFALLREGEPLPVVASAEPLADGRVALCANPARIEQLLAQLAESADLEPSPTRQRRLYELCDVLQEAVLHAQKPRRGAR